MKLRLVVVTLVVSFMFSGNALARGQGPGLAGCLNRAQTTVEAEHQLCIDTGRSDMLAACTGAAAAALLVCLEVPHPISCIAANAVALLACGGIFWTEYDEAKACMKAADSRYHQAAQICREAHSNDPHDDPQDVQDCRNAAAAESNHIPG